MSCMALPQVTLSDHQRGDRVHFLPPSLPTLPPPPSSPCLLNLTSDKDDDVNGKDFARGVGQIKGGDKTGSSFKEPAAIASLD